MSAHTHHNGQPCEACTAALTYTCDACGKASLKERWGPGRITCPECGAVQRSPAELAAWQPFYGCPELIEAHEQRTARETGKPIHTTYIDAGECCLAELVLLDVKVGTAHQCQACGKTWRLEYDADHDAAVDYTRAAWVGMR